MAKFTPTDDELAALQRLFDLAEGFGGGALKARTLLCSWWNATELGGFDLSDLWGFDDVNLVAAVTVIKMIAGAPVGTYADSIEGFEKRMPALAQRRAKERGAELDS